MKRRLPPRRVAGGLLNLRAFKSAAYSTYCASAFVIFLGVYTGEFSCFPGVFGSSLKSLHV